MEDCKCRGLTRVLESTQAAWPCLLMLLCILLQERAAAAGSLDPQPPPAGTNGATDSSAGLAANSAVLPGSGASGLLAQRRGPFPPAAGSTSGRHMLGAPATAALHSSPSLATTLLPGAEVPSLTVTAQR